MNRKLISTGSTFERMYSYSRAVVDGDYVFVSGTTGFDYERMVIPGDVQGQTMLIFKTLRRVLAEAGSDLAHVVRVQYFVTRSDLCQPVLLIGAGEFESVKPAMSIYVVSGLLAPEMLVEIEVTARLSAR